MTIEPKELRREELAAIRALAETSAGRGASPAVEDLLKLLSHIAALEDEEHFLRKLNSRQAKLLTGVVNAIRGEPDELTLWSHHDAPELAQRAMRVVRAASQVIKDTAEFGIDPTCIAESIQHLADMMLAYAQLVERHEPLSTPGVPLPTWQEAFRKVEAGQALDPIEAFIVRLTPGDDERAEDFRRMLRAALDFAREHPKVDER